MIAWEGQSQAFDANGNMISVSLTNFLSYDYENRLTQAILAGSTSTYQYDGEGNRMSANRAGLVRRYILDRNSRLSQVLAETDSGGTITACYVYGLGLISRIDAAGNAQYYHYDSRGSTIALTAASGQITDSYAYDPFGTPTAASGVTDNRFRYLGRHGVLDETNGLNYIRARYYSARRGRFITKDPTTGKDGDSQSMNRYIYALNNPVRLVDISGLSAQDPGSSQNLLNSSDTMHNNLCPAPVNMCVAPVNMRVAPSTTPSVGDWITVNDPDLRVTYTYRIVKTDSELTALEKTQLWLHDLESTFNKFSILLPVDLEFGDTGGLISDPRVEVDQSSIFIWPLGMPAPGSPGEQIY